MVADNFTELTEKLFDDVIKQFTDCAYQLLMDGSDWNKTIELYKKDLHANIVKMIENERFKQMEKLFTFSHSNICDILEKEITEPIKNLEDDFWDVVVINYRQTIEDKEEDVKKILNDGFKVVEEEYDAFLKKLEEKIYSSCK